MTSNKAFLVGLFYRFHVSDKEVQKQFTRLYGEVINIILSTSSGNLRIALFRKLFPHLRVAVKVLNSVKERGGTLSPDALILIKSSVNFAKAMVEDNIQLSPNSYQSFRQIINQAFIEEISCDIGQFLLDYKSTKSLRTKIKALAQLNTMLYDYNFTQSTSLTARDLLFPSVKSEL